jgi:hypothetical protein
VESQQNLMTISHSESTDYDYLVQHNAVWRRHRKKLNLIIDLIEVGNYGEAHEVWEIDIPHEDQIVLNRATTKGGWFRPHERSIAVKGLDQASGWEYGDRRLHQAVE